VSCLALFQTTLHRNCHPSFAAAYGVVPVAVGVGEPLLGEVVVAGGDDGGDVDFDPDAVGVALVGVAY